MRLARLAGCHPGCQRALSPREARGGGSCLRLRVLEGDQAVISSN